MSTTVDLTSVFDNSKELDRLKKDQEDVLAEINKIHKKLQITPDIVEKTGDAVLGRLKTLYLTGKDLAEKEVSVSNVLMAQLDALLLQANVPAGQQRKKIDVTEPKKKRMKGDPDMARHTPVGTMRSQLELAAGLKGEQVAARVTPDDADKDEWFVVKVIHFDREAKEFEVFDEEPGDDEDGGGQRTYKLPMSRIIPFPKRNDPSCAPDYPTGKHVLAVYPGTTALYKATVVNPHRKRKGDDYLLEFDDDEEDGSMPQRTVPFHKVVPLPDGHRQ
ncbi:SAGA-associated factor 29 A [Ranunculus cassubicifolius]